MFRIPHSYLVYAENTPQLFYLFLKVTRDGKYVGGGADTYTLPPVGHYQFPFIRYIGVTGTIYPIHYIHGIINALQDFKPRNGIVISLFVFYVR